MLKIAEKVTWRGTSHQSSQMIPGWNFSFPHRTFEWHCPTRRTIRTFILIKTAGKNVFEDSQVLARKDRWFKGDIKEAIHAKLEKTIFKQRRWTETLPITRS